MSKTVRNMNAGKLKSELTPLNVVQVSYEPLLRNLKVPIHCICMGKGNQNCSFFAPYGTASDGTIPCNVFSSCFPLSFSSCTYVSLHLHLSERMIELFLVFYSVSFLRPMQSHEFVKHSVCVNVCVYIFQREWKRDWSSSFMLTGLPLIVWLLYLPLRL